MRLITQKDGDSSTYFDIIDESENGIIISSLKQILFNNHTDDSRGVIRGHLPLEYIFGICKSFKKITKSPGFNLELRASNRKRDLLYTTTLDEDVNVFVDKFSKYIPSITLSKEKQIFLTKLLQKLLHYRMKHGRLIENQSIQV